MSSQTKQDMTSEVIISDKVDSLHKVGGSPFHKNQHEKTCCPVARARWRVLGGVRVLQSKFIGRWKRTLRKEQKAYELICMKYDVHK
jgi:hypothetical protein